ncbi:MAG: PEP-CTERM sorting domain-containing protein [Phycisphaerales bacterium JB063]
MTRQHLLASLSIGIGVIAVSPQAGASLVVHLDPNDLGSVFQDGGVSGGTVAVNAAGQPIGWIESQVNGFDAQQGLDAKPTLAEGPDAAGSPYVMNFNGSQNLLMLDVNATNISSPTTELDTDTMSIVLVGRVGSGGDGVDHFINFNYNTSDLVSIEYDHATGNLIGRASGGSVSTAVGTDAYFVAELVWDSGNGLSFSVNGVSAGTDTSNALAAANFSRFRIGDLASAGGTGTLLGDIGDVYIFNDATTDNTALVSQLMSDYNVVPEPGSLALLALGGLCAMRRRRS